VNDKIAVAEDRSLHQLRQLPNCILHESVLSSVKVTPMGSKVDCAAGCVGIRGNRLFILFGIIRQGIEEKRRRQAAGMARPAKWGSNPGIR
jgi:hypothetical protein